MKDTGQASRERLHDGAYNVARDRYLDQIRLLFTDYKKHSIAFTDIQPGHNVMDVGCGTGDDARVMAGLSGPDGRVVGVDIDPALVAEAKRRAASGGVPLEYSVADAADLPFDDNAFDRTRADRVFQHVKNPAAVLAEVIRVTRPGGKIVVFDVDWATLVVDSDHPEMTRRILNFAFDRQPGAGIGRRLYGLFKRAGLSNVEFTTESAALRSYDVADFVFGFGVYSKWALEGGVITSDEAVQWLDDFRKKDAEGEFFSALSGFGVRGCKPNFHDQH